MGGNSSKLRKYLEVGDEESSLRIFEEHSELIKNFNANEPLNEFCESALLLCCKWAMTSLVKTLLYECNANPNRRNVFNQTAIHLICQIPVQTDEETNEVIEVNSDEDRHEKRAECLNLILDWNRVCLTNKSKQIIDKIDVNALDRNGNTCLHLAAINGLIDCVKILVHNNCELYIENESGDTACDLAAKYCHLNVLQYLEFKMVFSDQSNAVLSNPSNYCPQEGYSTLKWHELEESKNQLIAETSNMLNIPLSSSEVLLRSFDWSQESLIDNWFNESTNSVKESHFTSIKNNETIASENVDSIEDNSSNHSVKEFCEICSSDLDPNATIGAKCGHHFCTNCWKHYIELKIESGGTSAISCPAFNCYNLVTLEIIEKVVSPELIDRFVRNDIEAFIESNPYIQWCPHPGCNKAVHLPESQLSMNEDQYYLSNMPPLLPVSHAVDCGSGHEFCWECKREAHSPCDCKLWENWIIKISDIKAEELKQTYSRTEDAANCLWLVRNAKQCPRCKTHIQKTEGCNHLRCFKCKFDFCWVCLESWKKHNSGTGGYFRCNRSEAAQRAEQNLCLLKRIAEAQNCEMKELKKFVIHYTKYKFNCISPENEKILLERSLGKQRQLFEYSIALSNDNDSELVSEDDKFLSLAAIEMIRSRKVLCGCAVYGYYLEDYGYNKAIFELLENNLNYSCNRLSDIMNCDFLRNSRNYIIDSTNKVKSKRLELLLAVSKGLIPPETPPGLNKHRGRQCLPGVLALDSMENLCTPCDENDKSLINEAIISSLSELNDENSWIQDRNGRHNNLFAIYDWPDDCDIDYSYPENKNENEEQMAQNSKLDESVPEVCANPYCSKPKVQNPRTGVKHEFCSLKCKYFTEDRNSFENNDIEYNYEYDSSMDLLLAIEMSKISFAEELQKQSDSQSMDSIESTHELSEENNNENPFESFVKNMKTDPNINDSSTKTAVMFFLKSSFEDMIDNKNLNPSPNDLKVEKKLFSAFQ